MYNPYMNYEYLEDDYSIYLGPKKWTALFSSLIGLDQGVYDLFRLPDVDRISASLEDVKARWKFDAELKGGVTILRFHSPQDRTLFQLSWGEYL